MTECPTVYKSELRMFKNVIVAVVIQLILAIFAAMPASAAVDIPGGSDTDNGTGSDQDNGQTKVDYGYYYEDGGYRTYIEDKGGAVISPVVNMWMTPPDSPVQAGWSTALGPDGQYTIYYSMVQGNIPGIQPPYFNNSAFGPELDAWFQQGYASNAEYAAKGLTNAEAWIINLFLGSGGDIPTLLTGYEKGDYRIVVEAVYWYRVVDKDCRFVRTDDGQILWTRGTVRDIADYNQDHLDLIEGGNPFYGGGDWLGVMTNDSFCRALELVEDDTGWSGWGPHMGTGSNTSGRGGTFTYSDIKSSGQGFGMHIIYRDKAVEKWYTNDASAVGGPVEQSPGPAPDQPNIGNGVDEDVVRPVTVIKYYENINTRADGTTWYENAGGPFKQIQICRHIEIQDEADKGWPLSQWFTSGDRGMPQLWQDLNRKGVLQNSFKATTVMVGQKPNGDIDESVDHLYILFRRKGETEDPPPDVGEGLDMILYQSEISKAYITNQIKDNIDPEFEFNWSKPDEYSGECYHTEDQYEDREVPDPLPWDPNHTKTEHVKVADGEQFDHTTNWVDKDLNLILKLDEDKFNQFKYIMGTVDPFKTILNDENENYKTNSFDASGLTSKKLEDFSAKFVVWRGEDQPTINAYKASPGDSGQVDSLLDKTSADNEDQGQRKHSDGLEPDELTYEKDLSIFFKIDDSGDYTLGTQCQTGKHSDTVNILDSTGEDKTYEFKGPVTVHFYDDGPSETASTIKPFSGLNDGSQSSGGIHTGSSNILRRYPAYDEMEFYPYVQMSYQTTDDAGTTDGGIVYVLSSYSRQFKAGAAMKLKWRVSTYPGTGYSMLLRSDQWQTHATALEKYGKNMLLPGGAIYQLTSNGGAGVGQLGFTLTVEAWYPDIDPTYEDGIVSKDGDWNGSNGASEFGAFIGSAISNLTQNARIEMRVVSGQQNSAESGVKVMPGVQLKTLGNNQTASTDTKYYLKSEDPGAADSIRMAVGGGGGLAGTYKIEAFPDGKITVGGGGSLEKDQGADQISKTSAAGIADAYTSEMQNFIAQLSRNAGNDTDTTFGKYWAEEDGHWYNEAFGVKMNYYKGTITMAVPSNDGIGLGGVTAVLDPNLCPAHTSTATKFQSVNTAQFFVTLKSAELGQFGDATVALPGYGGYLMASQPFYIADYTVQDND